MKLLKNDFQKLAVALTLGALSIGFAPVAAAVSTYDASAALSITLTDVRDLAGRQQTDFWDVSASGGGEVFTTESGNATATGSVIVVDPPVALSIGSSISQSSSASGSVTGNGSASTDALTDLDITVTSESDLILVFSFDYDIMVDASATGVANATAQIDMLDDLGFVDIQAFADALSQPGNFDTGTGLITFHGTAHMTIDPFGSNTISGFIDSFGSAGTIIPVPAAVWLFGTGLIALVGVARRKQAA